MLIRDRGGGPDIVWSWNCRLATMTLLDKYSHYGYAHFSKERFKGGVLGFFILLNEYGLNSEVYMIIDLIRQNVNRRYLGTEYILMVFLYIIPLNPQVFFILLYIFMNSNVRKSHMSFHKVDIMKTHISCSFSLPEELWFKFIVGLLGGGGDGFPQIHHCIKMWNHCDQIWLLL